MKILLDTNVLFSGLGFRGVVGELLEEMVRQNHTIITSEYILEELRGKIRLKFKGPHTKAALDLLLYIVQRIPLEAKQREACQPHLAHAEQLVPQQDAPILALALLDDVDYFVTGDKVDFLENKEVQALTHGRMQSPREMLDILLGKTPR
ncbi:MAG: hypothetical protein A2Z21_02365 [Candidatus Fraserbacteria bacterium RBG_16_55_9]|uniref:PIN domain-containing protein n=1 Tax=Fraserbacteria sp. (strain RBG_16_55_9) TaxID=1817864 RepID=A0A1F5V1Q8_FRAXR|nr:MAG: hypothetical protein A2Z21_02365 [Candidatus Fraserbacteria bacterium RBG_16_55_9]